MKNEKHNRVLAQVLCNKDFNDFIIWDHVCHMSHALTIYPVKGIDNTFYADYNYVTKRGNIFTEGHAFQLPTGDKSIMVSVGRNSGYYFDIIAAPDTVPNHENYFMLGFFKKGSGDNGNKK